MTLTKPRSALSRTESKGRIDHRIDRLVQGDIGRDGIDTLLGVVDRYPRDVS